MPRFRARRWYQFGFGTLLIAVTVCGVWFGRIAYLAGQQREAIRLIESLGGTVVFDHKYEGSNEPPWPDWLRGLLGEEYFRRVQGVALGSEDFTDDGLSTLASLGDLRVLRFHSSKVTDEGIAKLRACKRLESLEIRWSGITDAAMADVSTLKNLKELRLYNTRITDAGFMHLVDMPQLTDLMIGNYAPIDAQTLPEADQQEQYSAPITDKALESIAKIPGLTSLSLTWCRETPAGLAKFSEARPNVKTYGGSGRAYTPVVPTGYSFR
jgi:hypothetical protein